MKILLAFLKQESKLYIVFFLFLSVFFLTFFLYHLPLDAILYPALLCFVIGAVIEIIHFFSYKGQHQHLNQISFLIEELEASLPEPASLIESDYQELIIHLLHEILKLRTENLIQYSDMVDYFSVWVHQIKTPITAMQLILSSEDTERSRILSLELFRIEQYVEMVLTYLRLGSDSTDYVFKETDLDQMLRAVLRKFSSEFIHRKLSLDYNPINRQIITDEKWFSFVIEQLLTNALKYTKEGTITIGLEDETLIIQDTGLGIDESDLPRIFEKGYTGYNGRLDKKASGLGLYLCKEVCQNLEIPISIESQVGLGTTVHLGLSQNKLTVE